MFNHSSGNVARMFEAVFNQSPVPCAILGHDGSLTACNDAFALMLGYSRSQLKDQPAASLLALPQGGRPVIPPTQSHAPRQLNFKHKDGHGFILSCSIASLEAPTEAKSGTIIQVLDPVPSPSICTAKQPPTLATLAQDHIREAVYLISGKGEILDANKAACNLLGYSREELVSRSVSDIDPNLAKDIHSPSVQCEKHVPFIDTHHQKRNGETIPVRVSSAQVEYLGDSYILAIAVDVSEEQRLEKMRFAILENLARGAYLNHTLQLIVDYVEAIAPCAIASIMLVNEDGTHLEAGPSNKLPSGYQEILDVAPVPIGEGMGACGTAAATKRPVEITDTTTHPYFDTCKDLMKESGLLSCWSEPIIGAGGEVFGTFCIYLNQPGQLPELGIKVHARRACHYAAIAIERHRAEHQILETQLRYRDIFTHSLDALAMLEITTSGLRILEANPAMERMVQLPHAQIVGRNIEEVVPANVVATVSENFQSCTKETRVQQWEIPLDLPAGHRHLHFTLIPLLNTDGELYRLIILTRDNTRRRQDDMMLHRRQEEFRALIENSPDGIIRYSPVGEVLYVNPHIRHLLEKAGLVCNEQSDFEALILPADRLAYRNALSQVVDTGVENHLVLRLGTMEDDLAMYQDVSLVPEFTPHGEVASVLSVMRDITPLKKTEVQLRTLVENSPTYICRKSPEGQLIFANPALLAWLGSGDVSPASLKRSNSYTRNEFAQLQNGYKTAIDQECMQEIEIYFSRKQEWHKVLFVPEKNEMGQIISVLSVGLDVTRQKHADADLRESRAILRELCARRESSLEAERKRIAHEIHDELGQLLTTLRLNLVLTSNNLTPDTEIVRQKLLDMTCLVDRTIKSVRTIATTLRPAVLNAGIASALEWLTQEFTIHSGIVCDLQIPNGIELDEGRAIVVFRVVQESLSNIGRHSGANQVWIHLRHDVTGFRLMIRDNGRGFDPASVSGKQSLGLIGMRERVLSLDGKLELISAPYLGTTLNIQIPAHPKRKAA